MPGRRIRSIGAQPVRIFSGRARGGIEGGQGGAEGAVHRGGAQRDVEFPVRRVPGHGEHVRGDAEIFEPPDQLSRGQVDLVHLAVGPTGNEQPPACLVHHGGVVAEGGQRHRRQGAAGLEIDDVQGRVVVVGDVDLVPRGAGVMPTPSVEPRQPEDPVVGPGGVDPSGFHHDPGHGFRHQVQGMRRFVVARVVPAPAGGQGQGALPDDLPGARVDHEQGGRAAVHRDHLAQPRVGHHLAEGRRRRGVQVARRLHPVGPADPVHPAGGGRLPPPGPCSRGRPGPPDPEDSSTATDSYCSTVGIVFAVPGPAGPRAGSGSR